MVENDWQQFCSSPRKSESINIERKFSFLLTGVANLIIMWICLVDISSRKRLIFLKMPLVISTSTTNQQDLLSDSSRLEAHGCQVSFLQLDEFVSQRRFSKLLKFIRSMKFSKLYSCSIIYTKKSGWRCFFQAVCQSAGYSRVPALASGSNFSSALPAGRARPSCLSQIKLTQC